MEIGKKWVISDEVLKESFDKLEIEEVFFSKFKEKAIDKLNDFACDSVPTLDDTDESIDIALEYIKEYASHIRKERAKSTLMLMPMLLIWNFKKFTVLFLLKLMNVLLLMGKTKPKRFVLVTFVRMLQIKVIG